VRSFGADQPGSVRRGSCWRQLHRYCIGVSWWPWTAAGSYLHPRMAAGWAGSLYSCTISCVVL